MTIQQTISQLANQCVLCGLCIPHCPTYKLFRTEHESPRGRISLLKALAEQQIEADEAVLTSLDHCLGCRACEKMCPSQVDYASISNLGRAFIASQYTHPQRSLKQKITEKILLTPALHPLLKLSAKAVTPFNSLLNKGMATQSSLATMASFSQGIKDSSSQNYPLQEYYPASGESNPQVILFKGCGGELFEQQTLVDAIKLLNACQFDVLIPAEQQCCGAISTRQGDSENINALAKQNIEQFGPLLEKSQAIISVTNSCSGHLKDYHQFTQFSGANAFSHKVIDIISFLANVIKLKQITFAPLTHASIGVHVPCSLKNVLKEDSLLFDLLEHIPGVQLIKINDQYCCGAAGSYMLQYPDIANSLLDDKIDDIMQQSYQLIVSSNIGCSLHFKQGLKKQEAKIGRKVEVIHPIHLLARQLIQSPR